MYGLHGKIVCQPGKRDELLKLFLDSPSTYDMPGCHAYIVSSDPADPDGIWIYEVWQSAEHHRASLQLEPVQALIAVARPLIAGFADRVELTPLGGKGLTAP